MITDWVFSERLCRDGVPVHSPVESIPKGGLMGVEELPTAPDERVGLGA